MADETAHDTVTRVHAEHREKLKAEHERLAAQSWYDVDPRLALLLAPLSSNPDATIELTVVADGTVISGSAVSETAWALRQHDQIRPGSPALADALDALQSRVDEQKRQAAEETLTSPALKTQDRYIHFLAPLLLSGGEHVHLQATRVDLRKVSAWSIGRVLADQEL
jgi:hypothetical protein